MSSNKTVGCVIAAVAGVVVLAAAAMVLVGAGYFLVAKQAGPSAPGGGPGSEPAAPVTATPPSTYGDDVVEKPNPTPAQSAAIEGGQTLTWAEQGMNWTVPSGWTELSKSNNLLSWKSPGSYDAGFINVAISPISSSVPADISLKAMYTGALEQKKLKKYDEVRWLELDGIKGVQFLETSPENPDDPRRLQWQAYRQYNGQQQLINIILNSNGKNFAKHSDALHGILYSTKVSK